MAKERNTIRSMRYILFALIGIGGISFWGCSMRNNKGGDDSLEDVISQAENGKHIIPPCLPPLFGDIEWYLDTICVVEGNAYYWAYDDCRFTTVAISDADNLLTEDPTLRIDSFSPECPNKFYVSVVGKTLLTDFADAKSRAQLASLSPKFPSFHRLRKDSLADFGAGVSYGFEVDFPNDTIADALAIRKWLVQRITASKAKYSLQEDDYRPQSYKGNIQDDEQIAKFAATEYFTTKKSEYGDELCRLYFALNLRTRVCNERFVTYQECSHGYEWGAAHDYYTEQLVSYDHVHKQEIDCNYLFKPQSLENVLTILAEEAEKTPVYKEWEPNIWAAVCNKDENGRQIDGFTLPSLGLSAEGVVFSFQPYAISGFAAGTFHFVVPYKRLKSCMSERGRWCVEKYM